MIESEDWLLGLIDKFISKKKKEKFQFSMDEGLSGSYLYEEINFDFLNEDRLKGFIGKLNTNEMACSLCDKTKNCFYFNMKESQQKSSNIKQKRRINYRRWLI